MDSKKLTKKQAAKKSVKTNVGKKIAGAEETAAKTKAAVPIAKPTAKKPSAVKNFLFSIPSHHTDENDFEHLVIASSMEEACKMLAESRCTEKWPALSPEQRAMRVKMMTHGYAERKVVKVEPRKEAPTVVQINHHKLGNAATPPTPETLTLQ